MRKRYGILTGCLVIIFVWVHSLAASNSIPSQCQTTRSGRPLTVITVHEKIPVYASSKTSLSQRYFSNQYAPAFLYVVTNRRAAISSTLKQQEDSMPGYVAVTNIALRPSNLVFQPKTNTLTLTDGPYADGSGTMMPPNTPFWLVEEKNGWWKLSTPEAGWTYLFNESEPPMNWRNKEPFLTNIKRLHITLITPALNSLQLAKVDLNKIKEDFSAEMEGLFLPDDPPSSLQITQTSLNGLTMDHYLVTLAAAPRAGDTPQAVFIADIPPRLQSPLAPYTLALLKKKNIRIYAANSPWGT